MYLADDAAVNSTVWAWEQEDPVVETAWGTFHHYICTNPKPQPKTTMAFFFAFTVITAMIVLSLFISVITAAMFEVMEQNQRERVEQSEHNMLSPEMKRTRVVKELKRRGSLTREHLKAFFGLHTIENDDVNASQYMVLAMIQRGSFRFTHSAVFHGTVMCVIFGVAMVEVCELNMIVTDHELLELLELIFTVFFSAEAFVKIVAEGTKPLHYFASGWNRFDFFLVLLAAAEQIPSTPMPHNDEAVGCIRVLRLFRVVKLFNSFPRLHLVTKSLLMSCKQVAWVLIMIFAMNFMFALVAMLMFGRNDPQHFGSFATTATSIWMIETFDDCESDAVRTFRVRPATLHN